MSSETYTVVVDNVVYIFSTLDVNKYLNLFLKHLNFKKCWVNEDVTLSSSSDYQEIFQQYGIKDVYLNTQIYDVFVYSLQLLKTIGTNFISESNQVLKQLYDLYSICTQFNTVKENDDISMCKPLEHAGEVGNVLFLFTPVGLFVEKEDGCQYLTDFKSVKLPIINNEMVLCIDEFNNVVLPQSENIKFKQLIYFYKIPYTLRAILDRPYKYFDDYLSNHKDKLEKYLGVMNIKSNEEKDESIAPTFECLAVINSHFLDDLLAILIVLLFNILDKTSIDAFIRNSNINISRYQNKSKNDIVLTLIQLIESFNLFLDKNITSVLKTIIERVSILNDSTSPHIVFKTMGKYKMHETNKMYNFENLILLINDLIMYKGEILPLYDIIVLKTLKMCKYILSNSSKIGDSTTMTHMFVHDLMSIIIDIAFDHNFEVHKEQNTHYYNTLIDSARKGKTEQEIMRYMQQNGLDTSEFDRVMCVHYNHDYKQRVTRYLDKFNKDEKNDVGLILDAIYKMQESKGSGLSTYTISDLQIIFEALTNCGFLAKVIDQF